VAAEGDGEEQGDEEDWTAVHAYARAARAVRAARATAPTVPLAWPLLPPSWRRPITTTTDTATDTTATTAAAVSALEGAHEVLIFLAGTGAAWAAVPVRPRNFLSDALGAHLAALRGAPSESPPASPSHAPAAAAPAAPHAPGNASSRASSEVPHGALADAPSAAHLLPRARVLLLLAHALRADYHLLTLPLRRALRAAAGDLHGAGPAAAALAAEADAALRAMGFD
jgi:hypothetical protein